MFKHFVYYSQLDSLNKYKEATACLTVGPEIVIDEPKAKDNQEIESSGTDIPPLVSSKFASLILMF